MSILNLDELAATTGKLLLAIVLGGAVGWEREIHGRTAGLRTVILVCLGVVLFCEVSRAYAPGSDPSRIAAQVVTGIGFLGAGTILHAEGRVRGLTTAASVWTTAAIGMCISSGGTILVTAIIATLLVIVVLALLERVDRKVNPNHES